MKVPALVASLAFLSACSTEAVKGLNLAVMDASSASPPSSVTTSPPQPVDPATDVVNLAARSELAIGMVMEIRVTPNGPELMSIGMMQVRKSPRGANVTVPRTINGRKETRADGDWVIVEAYNKGALVSRTAVSDPALIAVEGTGLIRLRERTVYASLPTPRRVDTLEITDTAGGGTKRIDVSAVMDHFCNSAPNERACQSQ
jgi:hypothetical protein